MNFEFPEMLQVQELYPHGYHKTDKYGRPVYIERIGMAQLDKLFEITTKERMLKYQIKLIESLFLHKFPSCCMKKGSFIQQQLVILDLKDVPLSEAKSIYDFVKTTSETTQNYYPEILYKMYIVNVPWLFKNIWNAFKTVLAERTISKIKIFGDDFFQDLSQEIDIQDIPSFLGGQCQCSFGCLQSEPGPWKQIENNEEIQQSSVQLKSIQTKDIPIQKLIESSPQKTETSQNNSNNLDTSIESIIRFININQQTTNQSQEV